MLNWIRRLVGRLEEPSTAAEHWIAGASNPADVESRLLRLEQRASAYGLRLP